jgi:hypothetical protein
VTHPDLLPSRFRLPQHCSPDRRRAREATLRQQCDRYALVTDPPVSHDREAYALPPRIAQMPPAEEFTPVKRAWMLQHKVVAGVNALSAMALNPTGRMDSARDYARLLITVPPPDVMRNWRDDAEFARQRLNGSNPRELRAWRPAGDAADDDLLRAAGVVLRHDGARATARELAEGGRLFAADYGEMTHPLVRQHVAPGLQLHAPLALFYADERRALRCLAIRMAPGGRVVTPLATDARWLYARSHVQAADGLIHEGVRHLMETHLVTERRLHPDHPVSQLLAPHLRFTVALDSLARVDLLSIGGPIDLGVAAGVTGALNLARLHWKGWDFGKADPEVDFADRGFFAPDVIADHHYRDDSLALWGLIRTYVREVLDVWYRSDADVAGDAELQSWAHELRGPGSVRGFPDGFATVADLALALARVVFRTTAGHAAVNNGQFEKYTWVPNSPGSMQVVELADDEPMSEDLLWQAFPSRRRSLAQLSMAWILSTPTDRSIIAAGDVPAFDPALSPPAAGAVGAFRRALKALSARIGVRNEGLVAAKKVPYTWLDPYNVSCSIDT